MTIHLRFISKVLRINRPNGESDPYALRCWCEMREKYERRCVSLGHVQPRTTDDLVEQRNQNRTKQSDNNIKEITKKDRREFLRRWITSRFALDNVLTKNKIRETDQYVYVYTYVHTHTRTYMCVYTRTYLRSKIICTIFICYNRHSWGFLSGVLLFKALNCDLLKRVFFLFLTLTNPKQKLQLLLNEFL